MIEFFDAGVVAPSPTGEVTIVHPLRLTLAEQRISIIGANGSGKSTIARLCNGLVTPTTGTVMVRGADRPLDTIRDGAAVRRLVGFMFTDPTAQLIMPTVVEDVALSLRREYRGKAERHTAALEVLTRFGIAELAERSVHTLSGGQKQLLALASVLACHPAVLVADEPTTLLDLRNARVIGDLLMSLSQQVIVVTHDLELAARADRTLLIDDGRVIFDGDPAEAVDTYRSTA